MLHLSPFNFHRWVWRKNIERVEKIIHIIFIKNWKRSITLCNAIYRAEQQENASTGKCVLETYSMYFTSAFEFVHHRVCDPLNACHFLRQQTEIIHIHGIWRCPQAIVYAQYCTCVHINQRIWILFISALFYAFISFRPLVPNIRM